MDPRTNPYAPGAGSPPPELAGRDDILERASIALDRIKAGRPARSFMLIGLRGVGKTVLLDRIMTDAEADGIAAVRIEAPEDRSLASLLAPGLRGVLLKLSRMKSAEAAAHIALRALAGFVSRMKLKYGDVEVMIDVDPEPGLADTGDLELDLADLLEAAGRAAKARGTALVLFIDELQYVPEDQLAALIAALHRTAQRQLPICLVGAGLPQLTGQMGKAKSYAERLFEFVEISALDKASATIAIVEPAKDLGVKLTPEAVKHMVADTQGYPYFIQEWGKHAWAVAEGSTITLKDARIASIDAVSELDASFFRVRFDRLTPSEKTYLRAMADLGPGPHRSGDIADKLERSVNSVAPIRAKLIGKGMIYAPSHGDTAFTVPLFDGFIRRVFSAHD